MHIDSELCVLKAWPGTCKIHLTGAEWATDEPQLDTAPYSSVLCYCGFAAFGQSMKSSRKTFRIENLKLFSGNCVLV